MTVLEQLSQLKLWDDDSYFCLLTICLPFPVTRAWQTKISIIMIIMMAGQWGYLENFLDNLLYQLVRLVVKWQVYQMCNFIIPKTLGTAAGLHETTLYLMTLAYFSLSLVVSRHYRRDTKLWRDFTFSIILLNLPENKVG